MSQGQHLLRRGFELRLSGDYEHAIALFSAAVDAEPSLLDVRTCGQSGAACMRFLSATACL